MPFVLFYYVSLFCMISKPILFHKLIKIGKLNFDIVFICGFFNFNFDLSKIAFNLS